VSQKPQRQSVERQDFIQKEVQKLLDVGFIEEVHHPVWLANPVIVPKANGKLRMCIDYIILNKACPKDPYPLPRIDQIVDSTSGCDLLSFLDAYSGFHQIQMSREDRKHTAFVTVDGLYCYVIMPYGLKNALPTFVRAMNKTFRDLIRDKVEVYVDDIVVKTKEGRPSGRLNPGLRQTAGNMHEAEPGQVRLWCLRREVAGVPGFAPGH
jgi:hypothetical protein